MTRPLTERQRRAIVRAVAELEPRGISVELVDADRAGIREQVVLALAPVLGLDDEQALVWLDSARMTGGSS